MVVGDQDGEGQLERDRTERQQRGEGRWRRLVDVAHIAYALAATAYAVAAWYEIFAG